jgi:hypothetical protein
VYEYGFIFWRVEGTGKLLHHFIVCWHKITIKFVLQRFLCLMFCLSHRGMLYPGSCCKVQHYAPALFKYENLNSVFNLFSMKKGDCSLLILLHLCLITC